MRTKAGILVSHRPPPSPLLFGPGLKIWKGGVHAVKIMVHYQYKFHGVICILCNLRRKKSFN